MTEIKIHGSDGYGVYIGRQITADILPLLLRGRRVLIVTDSNVSALWLGYIYGIIGSNAEHITVEASEASKSPENLIKIWNVLASHGFGRDGLVIALGGGTVGDLAGFAASTYMRGIGIIQIPTTLLSCIDSSVGGKTAIDLSGIKNVAGTFRRPEAVICDTVFLDTLPEREASCGKGEMIKYALACDPSVAQTAEKHGPMSEELISACVNIKKKYVEDDEFDRGGRAILNFGHTVGHAAEALSRFGLSHGEAVAVGMSTVIRAEKAEGLLQPQKADEMIALIEKNGLPTECCFSAEEIADVMKNDKKRISDAFRFVLLKDAGKPYLREFGTNEAIEFIRKGLLK